MTLVVALLGLTVALLALLVAGLLRSHAEILRRLHDLEDGATPATATPRGVPEVTGASGRAAPDIAGATPDGGAVVVRVAGHERDTVLAFLSTGCGTCVGFWEAFAAGVHLPASARLVIVTNDPENESASALARLAPDGVTVVQSSAAWSAYEVPGSPYVIHVDGPTGRVVGEGTGQTWEQVAGLLAEATGDLAYVEPGAGPRKASADRDRERDADAALLQAGIVPGDPRLYQALDQTSTTT